MDSFMLTPMIMVKAVLTVLRKTPLTGSNKLLRVMVKIYSERMIMHGNNEWFTI